MIRRLLFLAAVVLLAFVGCGKVHDKIDEIRSSPPVVALTAKCHYRYVQQSPLPDPKCTPGVTNPAVYEGTIGATICTPGWTKTVRPPTSYTTPHKLASMREYGVTMPPSAVEFDHAVPLSVGGAPADLRNLWPEPIVDARRKDTAEVRIQHDICSGRMTLQQGQATFLTGQWMRYETSGASQLVD